MNSQPPAEPTLRPGQRIRLTIEGTVERTDGGGLRLFTSGSAQPMLVYGDGTTSTFAAAATIEVLAEPRPDEPTGLGAVVEANGLRYLCAGDGVWIALHEDARGPYGFWTTRCRWDRIPDPITVLSPGWEPTDGA